MHLPNFKIKPALGNPDNTLTLRDPGYDSLQSNAFALLMDSASSTQQMKASDAPDQSPKATEEAYESRDGVLNDLQSKEESKKLDIEAARNKFDGFNNGKNAEQGISSEWIFASRNQRTPNTIANLPFQITSSSEKSNDVLGENNQRNDKNNKGSSKSVNSKIAQSRIAMSGNHEYLVSAREMKFETNIVMEDPSRQNEVLRKNDCVLSSDREANLRELVSFQKGPAADEIQWINHTEKKVLQNDTNENAGTTAKKSYTRVPEANLNEKGRNDVVRDRLDSKIQERSSDNSHSDQLGNALSPVIERRTRISGVREAELKNQPSLSQTAPVTLRANSIPGAVIEKMSRSIEGVEYSSGLPQEMSADAKPVENPSSKMEGARKGHSDVVPRSMIDNDLIQNYPVFKAPKLATQVIQCTEDIRCSAAVHSLLHEASQQNELRGIQVSMRNIDPTETELILKTNNEILLEAMNKGQSLLERDLRRSGLEDYTTSFDTANSRNPGSDRDKETETLGQPSRDIVHSEIEVTWEALSTQSLDLRI